MFSQMKSIARVRFQPGGKIHRVQQKGRAPSFLPHPCCSLPLPGSSRPFCLAARGFECLASPASVGHCARGACAVLTLPSPAARCRPHHPLFLFMCWRSFLSPGAVLHQRASPWAAEMPGNNHSSILVALWRTKDEVVVFQRGCCLGHSLILCAAEGGVAKGTTPQRFGVSVGSERPRLHRGRAIAGATGG